VVTNGFTKNGERKVSIWDIRKLQDSGTTPLQSDTLSTSPGLMVPFYDPSTEILILAGRGDNSIRYYEIVDDAPYFQFVNNTKGDTRKLILFVPCSFLSQYTATTNQTEIALFPRRMLDVTACEVFRFAKLSKDKLEHVMFQVPRKVRRLCYCFKIKSNPTNPPHPPLCQGGKKNRREKGFLYSTNNKK